MGKMNWGNRNANQRMKKHGTLCIVDEMPYGKPNEVNGMIKAHRAKIIEDGKSSAGGYTRKQLKLWGISWPPPKGWKDALIRDGFPKPTTPD